MSIKVIRYRLPSYWACPLINDDYTGLTDEECESGARVGECECGFQKAHDTLGIKYGSFGAILKNFG